MKYETDIDQANERIRRLIDTLNHMRELDKKQTKRIKGLVEQLTEIIVVCRAFLMEYASYTEPRGWLDDMDLPDTGLLEQQMKSAAETIKQYKNKQQ